MANTHSKRFAKGVNKMLNQRTINPTDMSFQPNTIYCGDCKDVLKHFQENCVDLIYLDPPFFSNRHMKFFGTMDMNLEHLRIGGRADYKIMLLGWERD